MPADAHTIEPSCRETIAGCKWMEILYRFSWCFVACSGVECTGNWMEPIVISVGAYVYYLEGNRFRSHAVDWRTGRAAK